MVSVCMCVNYQELKLARESGEKLGISVQGGVGSRCGNPFDSTDEGIFISQVISFKYLTLPYLRVWGGCCGYTDTQHGGHNTGPVHNPTDLKVARTS